MTSTTKWEQMKESKDIIDRTVWFINTLSPHNLHKGREALDELIKAQSNELVSKIEEYKEALIWCSGSQDFQLEGKARKGWEKIRKRLLKS